MEVLLPKGPPYFPEETITDLPERFIAAEMIREKIFRLTGHEIPYSTAVTVDSFSKDKRDTLVKIHATIHVERASQKGIIIGKDGSKLKMIGTEARKEIERMMGTKIFLKLGANVVAVEPQDDCVKSLTSFFRNKDNLKIVNKAVGSSSGEAELLISDANTISSLSKEWVKAVKASGRFSNYSWGRKKIVPVTTLDILIEKYGKPTFIKIDVEGFEKEVLAGLSRPVNTISLEFTPEFIHSTLKCIEHLDSLGEARFNYSTEESMKFNLAEFVTAKEISNILTSYVHNNMDFGDVYCKFL